MAIFHDEPARKNTPHEIGQDLSRLSIDDLRARIDMLRGEITRVETELHSRGSTRSAAEALFRRS
ncbi:uncharacterized small protein (DUF1192 family) [Aquamicrobium lusatiense]|uniref:Uncharacterized small protein (DUF1192 family) n=1 Tax=Aquamicrobium lusatiense TaxID=89772 RepID=A0A7W9RZC3_9HYPH|nr:DUF1192 domain-containing protein [Aquamicrobium lusatiense]MBB6011035.1 uncharacterized small protein (DUF1192 family) [Aquamicrobium lusatiense]